MLILSACTTAPKKPTPLPNAQVNKLKWCVGQSPACTCQGRESQWITWYLGCGTKSGSQPWGDWHHGRSVARKWIVRAEGLVADLRNNNLGGKVIWILGPSGSWHYYSPCWTVTNGGWMSGIMCARWPDRYVGNTGNARHTAPHLHYGIYLNGKGRGAVNPYPYLR